MLISREVTAEYRSMRDTVTSNLLTEFGGLMTEVITAPAAVQREAIFEVLPALAETHLQATSAVSAAFFSGLAEMQDLPKLVLPDVLEPSVPEFWRSLIGWGSSDRVLERGGAALMYSLIAGGLTRRMSMAAADTMIGNAAIQTTPMRSQRVPQPGCCAWCGMLASRFAAYTSEASAGKVSGRGIPVGQGRGKGSRGRGRGLKPRGSQAIGEDFHDHCQCEVVVVTEENEVQLQADADRYYDQYRDAADKINDGLTLTSTDYKLADGSIKSKYTWVHDEAGATTPESRTSMIVASMRQELNVR
ncbi:hypothetical protein [Arthrobacter glacialis]|uniref:VG15 protein n=1 Tax=Arthrobacter glacialis TaxID=1664 RepID=UPI000CD442E1|nr:hypothetical protein [Arthrobacter glacialis]POH58274.1 hypothetical protein CVS28_12590 [Arthrobacter glacialis]